MEGGASRQQPPRGWLAPFSAIWLAQAFSLLGSALVQFALVWWLTETTGSAIVLAMATLVALLPGIVIGPFAGALVDRWNRQRVMMVADGLVALTTLALAGLFATGTARVGHVYLVMFLRATAEAFHWPAMQASTSLMVPEKALSRVAGLNQMLDGARTIAAPPLAALLLSVLPLQSILAIDVGTALLAITPLFFVSIPQPQRQPLPATTARARFSVWQDVQVGWRYVLSWPGLLAVLVMATALNFLANPAFSLMPLLVTRHFGGGPLQLGWLDSSWGIGMVGGGLLLSLWGGFRRRILTSLTGLIGMGLGILIVGVAPTAAFRLALGGMFLSGLMNPIVNGPLFAVIQSKVTPDMQGRVFTVIQSAAMLTSPLSMAVAGPVADFLGVRVWYWVAGLGCVLIGGGAFLVPAIVRLEDDR